MTSVSNGTDGPSIPEEIMTAALAARYGEETDTYAWSAVAEAVLKAAVPHFSQDTIRSQARRYMEAAYGPNVWFTAPEAFDNILERWIWAVASGHEGVTGEQAVAEIEEHVRMRRIGD